MAKSRGRHLADLLNTSGLVKKSKSALAGSDEVIDLNVLPTITNAKLENSSIGIAGHTVSLGSSATLAASDLSDINYTTTPTAGQILVWDNTNGYWEPGDKDTSDSIAEGSNNLYFPLFSTILFIKLFSSSISFCCSLIDSTSNGTNLS